jgi:hypothetical protein
MKQNLNFFAVFFLGLIAGVWFGAERTHAIFRHSMRETEEVRMGMDLLPLKALRDGNTKKATTQLENLINTHLEAIMAIERTEVKYADLFKSQKEDPIAARNLKEAHDYVINHPSVQLSPDSKELIQAVEAFSGR